MGILAIVKTMLQVFVIGVKLAMRMAPLAYAPNTKHLLLFSKDMVTKNKFIIQSYMFMILSKILLAPLSP